MTMEPPHRIIVMKHINADPLSLVVPVHVSLSVCLPVCLSLFLSLFLSLSSLSLSVYSLMWSEDGDVVFTNSVENPDFYNCRSLSRPRPIQLLVSISFSSAATAMDWQPHHRKSTELRFQI